VAQGALRAGRRALALVAHDTEATYLANEERQLAVERLLIQFGEAIKDLPPETLKEIDPTIDWSGPKRFRDLAAHWYTEGLDHRLIWRALRLDLPTCCDALERYLLDSRAP
jgi:uncharacterized protein with HEPN domain